MKTIKICVSCRTPLPEDAPAGLCPQCLLQSEAPTSAGAAGAAAGSKPRPVPGEAFGDYRIERLLGRGGMGEVYEAEHLPTNRRVALKVMNQSLASDTDRKRFLREGRLAASVSHPNVVYIYGSEEIADSPVIAMELVSSGTLKDQIKRQGPLRVPEAVDAALQIIAGLEAAQSTGVLHRDIKPANCFIGADGSVKVGDFGLSISTVARGESLVTASGSVLGTPAYASPEQLRGEDLGVTSDIYSVGATLYHLLTGRPPHETTDFIKLITEVLDKTPPAPDQLRTEVPPGLARIVMRCLAKPQSARFPTYQALREALLPFSSTAPSAALLGPRFIAGFVDEIVVYAPSLLILLWTGRDALERMAAERTGIAVLVAIGFLLWDLLYYTIPEGLWGAAVGKAICGLRVVGPSRGVAGWPRALLRSFLFRLSGLIPALLTLVLYTGQEYAARAKADQWNPADWLWLPILLLLFSSMRRRNGYAGWHELATGTRVVARPTTEQRPLLRLPSAPPLLTTDVTQLGPYEVRGSLGRLGPDGSEWLLAHDPALRRDLWIHRQAISTPAVGARRRDLSRPARLRWLHGDRNSQGAWDAYEALDGWPVAKVPPQTWSAVRFWLRDLAGEYVASQSDSTETERNPAGSSAWSMDRIWITAQNRAVLLDFPCSTDDHDICPPAPRGPAGTDFVNIQKFFHALAEQGLGRTEAGGRPHEPLHAQRFLRSLAEGRFESPEIMAGNLQSLLNKPATVTPRRRLAALALAIGPALLLGLCVGAALWISNHRAARRWPNHFPGGAELRAELRGYDVFRDHPVANTPGLGAGPATDDPMARLRRAFKIHLAAHHRELIADTNFWAHPVVDEALSADQRRVAEEAVADYPSVQTAALEEADAILRLLQPAIHAADETVPEYTAIIVFWSLLLMMSVLDLGCALILGEALIFRLLGIATVGRSGGQASRFRVFGRTLLAWMPWAGGAALTLAVWLLSWLLSWLPGSESSAPSLKVGAALFVLLMLGGLICSVWRPRRNLADWVAGTSLVPR